MQNGAFAPKTHQMFVVHNTPEKFENGGFTLKTHQMFAVHNTPEEFENGAFAPKTHQLFSVHTTPEKFENSTITGHFEFIFEEALFKKSRDYRDVIVFTNKASVVIKIFSVHTKTKNHRFQVPPVLRAFFF